MCCFTIYKKFTFEKQYNNLKFLTQYLCVNLKFPEDSFVFNRILRHDLLTVLCMLDIKWYSRQQKVAQIHKPYNARINTCCFSKGSYSSHSDWKMVRLKTLQHLVPPSSHQT